MMILAIDPGSVSGAYAAINGRTGAVVACDDMPMVDKQVSAADWARVVRSLAPTQAVIELVGTMPKQGIASGFKFGVSVGLVRGVLAALHVPLFVVTPAKWKRFFALPGGKDKESGEKSRALALRYYPQIASLARKKDHNRAEALLLARYYLETQVTPEV